MAENHFDAYIIPTTDFHGSEYVNPYFMCRKFISGFTGSEGTLVVTKDQAFLWTDGRYFLQAAEQLEDSGIELMKMGQPDVPTTLEFLGGKLGVKDTLAFDGRVVSSADGLEMERNLNCHIVSDVDLVDQIWLERPLIVPSEIYKLPDASTGKSPEEKIEELRSEMKANGADYVLMTNLEEIAWLLNLRASDVECTPVFFSFALIANDSATFYLYRSALDLNLMPPWATVKEYMDIEEDLKTLPSGKTIWANDQQVNYKFLKLIDDKSKIISSPNPVELMKALKNPSEIASTRNAHIKDGVAVTKFLYWLKHNIGKLEISEISASEYLENCRKSQDGWFDSSFPTISGYGPHGAIIHYGATPKSNMILNPSGFLLVDSGAQYLDGTTDITRTIALGPLSDKMRQCYTAVLKCHIMLATSVFVPGTKGIQLDRQVRKPVNDIGLNYNHGTGHGVGHVLSVHEWPNNISPRSGESPILPNMITSNEPGVYIEGEFGIRLENEILCYERGDGKYAFETITFCPFDKSAILADSLSSSELNWLRDYSRSVYDTIAPFLTKDEALWLKEETIY